MLCIKIEIYNCKSAKHLNLKLCEETEQILKVKVTSKKLMWLNAKRKKYWILENLGKGKWKKNEMQKRKRYPLLVWMFK